MTWPSHGPRVRRSAGRSIRLLAVLALLATAAACAGQSDQDTTPPASPAPTVAATTPPATAAPATTPPPTRSTAGTSALPQPIRVLHQGDRLVGVYWVAASPAALSPVERRLQTLGYPASSGDLDCDQGARRWLGVPATITARVAVYFGTEPDARAFAQRVPIQPRPRGHAAATLSCLD
jgi:hypothetical protein